VVGALGYGGLERMVTSLIGVLHERGHQQSVCCIRTTGGLVGTVPPGVRVYNLEAQPNALSLPLRLRKIFHGERPTVVHTHNWAAWPEATIAAASVRSAGVVQTFHGFLENMPARRRLAARVLSRMTRALTVVSRSLIPDVARFCGVRPDRIRVIHNGIDDEHFAHTARKEDFGPADDSIRTWCATVGSLTPPKHPENLLEAARLLPKDIGFLWIGDGRLRSKLHAMSREMGIQHRVRWLGYCPDVRSWLDRADIVVSPSRSEALPLNVLEAMAMQKPVVATRVGGVPDIITDGVDGITVPAKNPQALADAIQTLAGDTQQRMRMGRRARERIIESFSLRKMANEYESLYRDVANNPVIERELRR